MVYDRRQMAGHVTRSASAPRLQQGDWRTVDPDEGRPFRVSFHWEPPTEDRGWRVTTIVLEAVGDGELKISQIARARLQEVMTGTFEAADFDWDVQPEMHMPLKLARPGPGGHPDWHFAQVAQNYKYQIGAKKTPGEAVRSLSSTYGVSEQTIREWLRRCRAMKLLPRTKRDLKNR